MFKGLFFILVLTVASIFYQYPTVYQDLLDRVPVWLGMKANPTLYRWLNTNGNWKISDKPPADGIEYEILKIRHDRQQVHYTQNN